MYKAPAAANLHDFSSADLATLIYPLNDDSPEAQRAAAAFPVTVDGVASRFALQAFRNSYYDKALGAWQVSHDRGRTWTEDEGHDYAGGLITGIIANMILWEVSYVDGANEQTPESRSRRAEFRRQGYALSKQPGIHDQVLAAAQQMLTEPYQPGAGDEMPEWTPRDINYDAIGCIDLDDWWTYGRDEYFRLTGTHG